MRIKRDSSWTDITGREVIAILPGSDPKLASEYVVLMGHLDHLGVKANAKAGEDRIFNGALDNAAGIATMLEAARAFVQAGYRPRRSIMFIANTAEEKGLLGSDYFAHNSTVPIGNIAAVVDLDMPLLLYDFTDVVAFGAEHSTVADAVARAAREMNVALSPDPMPEQHIFVRSDHYSFVKQGVPAVLLMTGFANGGEAQWSAFLNGAYHNVNDDMKQPIHWQQGARYARLNYLISRELADTDERPRWYRDDFFGDVYAPQAPKARRPRS
jgi:Zn-dependent M28 family amino/carboxypeptidase